MTRTIGILTVATNHYVEYWENMARSSHQTLFPNSEVHFHVFTDQPDRLSQFVLENSIKGVHIYKIDSLGWPDATLERYKIYLNHSLHLQEDFLMHLDADMLARDSAEFIFSDYSWEHGMLLVRHPGFYRPPQTLLLFQNYMRNPVLMLRDIHRRILLGGLGAWETNPKSMAYVKRKYRNVYVCGGIWLGTKTAFIQLIEKLANQVEQDLNNSLIAKWHDESHLNAWSSMNQHHLASPDLCHDSSYPNLKYMNPIITAVDKNVS